MKFRKKPVIIDAIQFINDTPERLLDIQLFMDNKDLRVDYHKGIPQIIIETLESDHQITNIGDWIIKGVKGEFYPIRNDIFEQTYELVK